MGTSSSVPVPRGLEVLPDTVVMVASRDGFDVIMALAAGSVAATFFAILLGMAFLFVQARATVRRIESLRRSLVADPAVKSLRETAANVEAVSDTVRTELVRLTESLGGVSDRVDQASRRMEERIEEFNALMEVVQREAEDVFLDTAATARGIRHGVRGSRRRPANPRRPSPHPGPPGPPPAHTDE
ncbi:MAG: hypothetical protein EA352_11045, partial [Gemmatimonadales bacterium]